MGSQTSAAKTYSASQSNQTIFSVGANKRFKIKLLTVSATDAGAGTITIFQGTNDASHRITKLNLANNGGQTIINSTVEIWDDLKYTTGSGAAGDISVVLEEL